MDCWIQHSKNILIFYKNKKNVEIYFIMFNVI